MNQKQIIKAYFLSDLHLRSLSEANGVLFLETLRKIKQQKATHLFMVGDIFDLWVADHKYFVDSFKEAVDLISEIQSSGTEVHYFEGNHDLYLKWFWQNRLGVQVHQNTALFALEGFKVRIEHGDLTDPNDTGYLFLRWFLRTPVMKVFAKNCPGFLIAKIGQTASKKSRKFTSEIKTISDSESLNKLHKYAMRARALEDFDLIVSGHIHIQDDFEFEYDGYQVRSVNLGTWLKQPVLFELFGQNGQFVKINEFLSRV